MGLTFTARLGQTYKILSQSIILRPRSLSVLTVDRDKDEHHENDGEPISDNNKGTNENIDYHRKKCDTGTN